MTGTPVVNSLTDFLSLYDTVKPGLVGSFQEFKNNYIIPLRKSTESEGYNLCYTCITKPNSDNCIHQIDTKKNK